MLLELVQEYVGQTVASEWAAAVLIATSCLFVLFVLKRIFFGRG